MTILEVGAASYLESLGLLNLGTSSSCLECLELVWRPYLPLLDLELDGLPYREDRELECLP